MSTTTVTLGASTVTVPTGSQLLSVVSHPTLGVLEAHFAAPRDGSSALSTGSGTANVQVKVGHGQKTGTVR